MVDPARRQVLLWTITVAAGVVLALGAAEIALRVLLPEPVAIHEQPCIYWSDAEWGYRYRPNAVGRKHYRFEQDNEVRINSQGFHDVERIPGAGSGALRVAALGDSFTAAIHVPVAKTWTQVAERALGKSLARPVQVHNLGIDGTGTSVHLAVLERVLPALRPDLVVLAFFVNDFEDVARGRVFRECFGGYVVNYQNAGQRDQLRAVVTAHAPGPSARWWFEHAYVSRLFPFVYGRETFALLRENYLSPSRFGVALDAPGATRGVPELFDDFLRLADAWGFAFVVMPVPPRDAPGGSLEALRRGLPAERLARLEVVDPSGAMEAAMRREGLVWSDLYWKHDAHFDADGNRILGLAAAQALADLVPAPVP